MADPCPASVLRLVWRLEDGVLPITEQMQGATPDAGGSPLLTGDLGVVVVQALLENGVGYVVSSWRERPTPIDAAIDDARERVLSPHGVVIRRLQSLRALEPIVTAPAGGVTGSPPRGAVVFAGRRSMRPALEQFLAVRCSGGVVGFTFDEDALRIEDGIVVDPEPTATGIVRAIDEVLEASVATGRPGVVVLRERALGMRGTIRRRPARNPRDAADADAAARAAGASRGVPAAVELVGLVEAFEPPGGGAARTVVVVAGPMLQATQRALAEVSDAGTAAESAVDAAGQVAIVGMRAVGVVPAAGGVARELLGEAEQVLVVGSGADRLASRLRSAGVPARIAASVLDPGSLRGEELVQVLAAWLGDGQPGHPAPVPGRPPRASRIPRRSDVLYRGVDPAAAAALALAQGVIGVPARMDPAYPTYRTDTGVALTVVPATVFAAHGAASAAPGTGHGVFVVTGSGGDVAAAAGRIGATVEHVDGSDPRAIGASIARSCSRPRVAPHVVAIAPVQRMSPGRHAGFGMDPELVGSERLSLAPVPAAATTMFDLGDELSPGPTVLALDVPDTHAALQPVRRLTPATWDLARPPRVPTRGSRAAWNLRRRMVRALTGVDL